jgi:hypothetical protein
MTHSVLHMTAIFATHKNTVVPATANAPGRNTWLKSWVDVPIVLTRDITIVVIPGKIVKHDIKVVRVMFQAPMAAACSPEMAWHLFMLFFTDTFMINNQEHYAK